MATILTRFLPCRLRITKTLHGRATDVIYCNALRVRWCSTSLEPQDNLVERKNFSDNIQKRLHVDDIRRLCQTDTKPANVLQLFNEFLKLPEHYRTAFVNSALYWFSYYDKIDEAHELTTLMENNGIPKDSSTYSSLAVLYSKSSDFGDIESLIEEMRRDGVMPRSRHYAPFFKAAVDKGDLTSAFHSLNEMQLTAAYGQRNTDKYTALIRACTGQKDDDVVSKVFEIFYDFRKYRDLLGSDTLEAVKLWFERQEKPKWITSWSTASATFYCQVCKQKLETGEFSETELEELKHPLAKHLWKKHRTVKQVKCFTSVGNYIDYVRPDQLNKTPQSVELFIRTTGPYDVVIDGLNVAYFTGFFDPRKVENTVLHFVNQKKRVLVVSSSPMTLKAQTKKGAPTSLGLLMRFLSDHEQCGVFCLAESSMDDLYFLSAAMHCDAGTQLVSCDRFYDHISGMDPLMKVQFRRWQNLYQMELDRFIGSDPVFATKKPYDYAVQTTGDTWHFPAKDGNRWLCVRKGNS